MTNTDIEAARQYAAQIPGGVVYAYQLALDNHEPMPRQMGSGVIVGYDLKPPGPYWDRGWWVPVAKWMTMDHHSDLLRTFMVVIDDGKYAHPYYVAGHNLDPQPEHNGGLDTPYVILHPFPTDPMVVSGASSWMLGPRTMFHLKIGLESE